MKLYCHHNQKLKSRVVIGFCLSALRTCGWYQGEEKSVENAFKHIFLRNHFIPMLEQRGYNIHNLKKIEATDSSSNINNTQSIIVPAITLSIKFVNKLVMPNTKIFTITSQTIVDRIRKNAHNADSDAGNSQINYLQCKSTFIYNTSKC